MHWWRELRSDLKPGEGRLLKVGVGPRCALLEGVAHRQAALNSGSKSTNQLHHWKATLKATGSHLNIDGKVQVSNRETFLGESI